MLEHEPDASFAVGSRVTSMRTWPMSGVSRPTMMRSSMDLPTPQVFLLARRADRMYSRSDGQALGRGLTVVTANTSEFSQVTDLSWEDWTI